MADVDMAMTKMKKTKKDPLLGEWRSADGFSEVVYRVSKKKSGYAVIANDTFDKEFADVFEEKWDSRKKIFSFAAHWNSTGRFCRCRIMAISEDQATLTFTYTDTELLIRTTKKKRATDR